MLWSPGLRIRQFTWHKDRAERRLALGVAYEPVTMSILRILPISDHVEQFIMSVLITSHVLRRTGGFPSLSVTGFDLEKTVPSCLSLLKTMSFLGKECQG